MSTIRQVTTNIAEGDYTQPDSAAGITATKSKSTKSSVHSAHSRLSVNSSVTSQRRLLEARAARQKAELETKRIAAEQALVDAQLKEEIALLGSDDDVSVRSNRTRDWVENTYCYKNDIRENNEGETIATPADVPVRVNNEIAHSLVENDVTKLTRVIVNAMKATAPDASSVNDKLLGRLSARDLPNFHGDPIDWLRFKRAYDTTSKIGQYSEEENLSRLQRCLHGEAYEAVAARIIATSSATDIMKILEMRFGRPDLVLSKLIAEMKKVPKLSGARSELVLFSTKIDNCVAAIESASHTGYLYSPELTAEITGKLTESLFYRWLDFYRGFPRDQPQLPILAKYLMKEAQDICRIGAVELPQKSQRTTNFKRPLLQIIAAEEDPDNDMARINIVSEQREKNCVFCDKKGHLINNCQMFKKLEINERWEWVCKRKVCFKCLQITHRRDRCKSKKKCSHCNGLHHALLHRHDWERSVPEAKEDEENNVSNVTETTANVWSKSDKKVYLKVLPVVVEGPLGTLNTFALLDEGSTVTLVEDEIANQVGAVGPEGCLTLQGAVGEGEDFPSKIIALTLKTATGTHYLERVRSMKNLKLPYHSINKSNLVKYEHLKNIPIETFQGRPTLLIGQDNWPLIVSRDVKEGKKNEPVASMTKLGWVLHGFSSSITKNKIFDYSYHIHENYDELNDLVKLYFGIENIELKKDTDKRRYSPSEMRALNILDRTSKNIGNRWMTGLLWKSDNVKFPDNKRNAELRLHAVEKMMDSDAGFAADYLKQVNNMLEKNYAEEIVSEPKGRVWFLPHFGVRNPNKPGKLRLVFDAKAETKGISLNSELLTGPDLLNSLLGVLLRFRERAVAVSSDIREMFLQVKIIPEDQNAQCFLWRGMQRGQKPRIYKMTSMIFGATSSPCTATYILRRNAEDFAVSHPRAVEAIKRCHYVDDYLDSVDTELEMKNLVNDVIMVHKAGGFDIRGWASNKLSVLPHEMDTKSISILKQSDSPERTLGLIWNPSSDTLGFDLSLRKIDKNIVDGICRPTKREVLKILMSIFDPLGILCPLLIKGKILLQQIWRTGIQWDEKLSDCLSKTWDLWLKDLMKCKSFSIPRCYGFSRIDTFQLHIFVDASEQAYASVSYLRRDREIAFVAARCRVTPLRPAITVPRIELQAAVMGARLGSAIQREQRFVIKDRFFWTDSQTVWRWINNNPRQKNAFISNRLAEIDELTKPEEWKWLPGSINVADEATRADKIYHPEKLKWVKDPDFLRMPENEWPSLKIDNEDTEEENETHLNFVNVTNSELTQESKLIDVFRFSNWRRLLRSIAYVLLFVNNCRKSKTARITPELEENAQTILLRIVQQDSFAKDLKLISGDAAIKLDSRLRQLNPTLGTDGLLRVNSRIIAANNLPINLKMPVILDAKHHVTKLLIDYEHRKLGHHSTGTLLNELRQRFYILRLRRTVRSLISNCIICKIKRGRCNQPMMASLPPIRLEHHCRPFTYCGIDLFGPMIVSTGRRHEKRWGVIFTCFSTRAIHIEVASSLTTDSTIMAIRRMAARRGLPKQMHSDNGTNFKSADKELRNAVKSLLNDELLANQTSALGIKWTFNPPEAPHMGGVWERLIRSIKISLLAVLNSQTPKEEVLITLLAETENIVNSRPLTEVSLDHNEEESLTPNHFLLGSSNGLPQPGLFSDEDLHLKCQWRISQRFADHFWMRWIREYAPTMQRRNKWFNDHGDSLQVGDLVVVADKNAPRNTWPRGLIVATIPGRDGRVRMADVRTRGGVLRRPANKLIVLMVNKNHGSAPEE